MKKIFFLSIFAIILFANSIIIIDTKKTNLSAFKKNFSHILANNEKVALILKIYNKKFSSFITWIINTNNNKMFKYLFKSDKEYMKYDVPYMLYIAYKINEVDPSFNKIYLVNSIFYKDEKFDFYKGYPSDSFAEYKNFMYLPKFQNPINCYIFVDSDNFKNSNYELKYKRFYYNWLKSKNINLISFNSEYKTKKENFNFSDLDLSEKLEIKKILPKRFYINDDKYYLTQNRYNNLLNVVIVNPERKNSWLLVKLNKKSFYIHCNNEGVCKKNLILNYGENLFEFTTFRGKKVKKKFKNLCDKKAKKDKLIKSDNNFLYFINPDRKIGEKIYYMYGDSNKTYVTNVYKNGKNHFFKIKLLKNIDKVKIIQKNCMLEEINIPHNIKAQKLKIKFNNGYNSIALNNNNKVYELKNGANTFVIPLPKPIKISKIKIVEADADNDTISIGVITKDNVKILITKDIPASGDAGIQEDEIIKNSQKCSKKLYSPCMIHEIDIPNYLKNMQIKSIFIKTKNNLNGLWYLKRIKIYKE